MLDSENEELVNRNSSTGESSISAYNGSYSGGHSAVTKAGNETYLIGQFDKESYVNENSRVGWLLSSKAIVQLVANLFVGPITNRSVNSIIWHIHCTEYAT